MSAIEIAWTVTGMLVSVMVGIGLAAVGYNPPEFRLARRCFWLSSVLLGGMAIVWHVQTGHSLLWRVVVSGLIGAAILILLPESLRWVARRELSAKQSQLPPAEPSPRTAPVTPSTIPAVQPKPPEPILAASPIDKLSELGWTVKRGASDITFEVIDKPLPDIKKSSRYLRGVGAFQLHLQLVKDIKGLHWLADINQCSKIEINAGRFNDLSELRGFSHLKSLIISQTPFDGLSAIDLSPLSSLTNLRELALGDTKATDIGPLANLRNLNSLTLGRMPIRDLSPIAGLRFLESLDITGAAATDLSPLAQIQSLRELDVDGKQLADLTRIHGLTTLKIVGQGDMDLAPVGTLSSLKSLSILGQKTFNLSALHTLTNLQELTVMAIGFGASSAVVGLDGLAELTGLKKLSLGHLLAGDLKVVGNLKHLEEINISAMPVSSVESLRGLASLQTVSIVQTNVVDISPLLGLGNLKKLTVYGSPVRSDVLTTLERNGVQIQR